MQLYIESKITDVHDWWIIIFVGVDNAVWRWRWSIQICESWNFEMDVVCNQIAVVATVWPYHTVIRIVLSSLIKALATTFRCCRICCDFKIGNVALSLDPKYCRESAKTPSHYPAHVQPWSITTFCDVFWSTGAFSDSCGRPYRLCEQLGKWCKIAAHQETGCTLWLLIPFSSAWYEYPFCNLHGERWTFERETYHVQDKDWG